MAGIVASTMSWTSIVLGVFEIAMGTKCDLNRQSEWQNNYCLLEISTILIPLKVCECIHSAVYLHQRDPRVVS